MNICAVILAAGRGKRMKSFRAKVLHEILGRPMIHYLVDTVKALRPKKTVIVVNSAAEEVRREIGDDSLCFVFQEEPLGTGNALLMAREVLKDINGCPIIVLNGDSPLITTDTLKYLLKNHSRDKNVLSFLSFFDDSASGYGRILRDAQGRVMGIVEERHATIGEKERAKELNAGVYVMEPEILHYLNELKVHKSSGEYYLTDIVGIVCRMGKRVEAYECSSEECRGVNTRAELYQVSEILRRRIISGWMEKGVTFIDPWASIVYPSVSIGKDTLIYPNTYLEGNTKIGRGCLIYPGVRIYDSILGDRVTVKDNTLIESSKIGTGSHIGPFAHLRPQSNVGRNVKIGNFVEIKKSTIGNGTKAQHLSYVGDAQIGRDVNIGAGTITCNYDGIKKHITIIESGAFVGSDTQLIAPVKIGRGAYVAAGATVTKDVPAGAFAISRVKQKNIKDWAIKRQLKIKDKKDK